jgi:arginyl-tRNA synthetase
MTPADLADAIVVAVRGVVADCGLDVPVPVSAVVERPRAPGSGDYATPVALQLARAARRPPRELAEALAARLRKEAGVAGVDVAGPGFLGISLTAESLGEIARTAVRSGAGYGLATTSGEARGDRADDRADDVDVVGAGPAGTVTLAAARRAVVGEALARLLEAAGGPAGSADLAKQANADLANADLAKPANADLAKPANADLAKPANADLADSAGLTAGTASPPGIATEVVAGQVVRLTRAGTPVVGPEWAGSHPTLNDLIDAVGVDTARYSLVRARLNAPLDLDLDVLTRQLSGNPAFWVRYTHARLASLVRNAADFGLVLDLEGIEGADVALLTDPREGELLRAVGELPRVVASAARLCAPDRLAAYLEELVGIYHRFGGTWRVTPWGDEEPTAVSGARLLLAEATRLVLANGLRLLGVGAPERM